MPGKAALRVRNEVVTLVEELGGHLGHAAKADLACGRRHGSCREIVVEVPAKTSGEWLPVARANDREGSALRRVVHFGREWGGGGVGIPYVAVVLIFGEVDVLGFRDEGRMKGAY